MSIILVGCSSHNANNYANNAHLLGTVDKGIFNSNEQYFEEYDDAYKCTGSCQSEYINYRDKGVYLVKSACEDELDSLAKRHKNHNASKDAFIAVGLLATGMMGINGASSNSFEKLAFGSAFTLTMFDIRENYYLLGPDRIEIINLLRKGLQEMADKTLSRSVLGFNDAYSQIRDVAYVCTNNQIDSLIKQSLAEGEERLRVTGTTDKLLIASYNKISEILQQPPLTDEQHVGMFAYVKLGERLQANDANGLKALFGTLGVPTSAQARDIATVYSQIPRLVLDNIESEYNKVKTAAAAAAVGGVAAFNTKGMTISLPNTADSSLELRIND